MKDSAHIIPVQLPLPRIGVALGGGSARGYAHIGALNALEKHQLVPDIVVGTSFGAIIGVLYALGKSVEDITTFACSQRQQDLWDIVDFGLHRAALFRGNRLEGYLDRITEGRHFSDLSREFVIVATDVDTGQRVNLTQGSLAKALRASSSLPGIFAPVEIDGRRLVDGGLGSPIPVKTLEDFQVDLAIGIGVGMERQDSAAIRLALRWLKTDIGQRLHQGMRDSVGGSPLRVLGRALAYTFNSWEGQSIPEDVWHVQAKPPISWLHFHRAELAIAAGEQAVEEQISSFKQAFAALCVPVPDVDVSADS